MFDDDFDDDFDVAGDVEEEFEEDGVEEDDGDPELSDAEFLERALGTMPCCGAVRRPWLGADAPCWNCGAI